MHNWKTHGIRLIWCRWYNSFSCKLKTQNHFAEINCFFFCDGAISLRNYFSKPMKFENIAYQWMVFTMNSDPLFYAKPLVQFVFIIRRKTVNKHPIFSMNWLVDWLIGWLVQERPRFDDSRKPADDVQWESQFAAHSQCPPQRDQQVTLQGTSGKM